VAAADERQSSFSNLGTVHETMVSRTTDIFG
jgi:hypothetical protein